jgi:DHA1 family tetracycline resistance protein-like MFS transporter
MKPSLRILFFVSMFDVLGFGVLVPLVPYLAHRFGASATVVTAIMGSYSACQLVAAPLWGRLSDRHGRRPVLMISLTGACFSYLLLGLANSLWMVLLSRMLAGAMAGNLAAAFAYASDVSTAETRARSMGMVGAAIGIGFMLGMPIGGQLAGNDTTAQNLMLPAVVSMMFSLLALAMVKFRLPESRIVGAAAGGAGVEAAIAGGGGLGAVDKEASAATLGTARAVTKEAPWRLLQRRPRLLRIVSSSLLVTSAQGILESIFALWALERFGAGPRTVGYALFGAALVAVLMQGGMVRVLAPKLGEVRLALFGCLAYAAGLLAVGLTGSNLWVVGLGLALCGAGMGSFSPAASALASKQALEDDRGAVMGIYQSGTSLARVIGPFVAGPIYLLGTDAPFLLASFITLPAAWLMVGVLGQKSAP